MTQPESASVPRERDTISPIPGGGSVRWTGRLRVRMVVCFVIVAWVSYGVGMLWWLGVADADAAARLGPRFWTLSLLAFGVLTGLAIAIGAWATRPLSVLVNAAHALREGRAPENLDRTGDDEIAILSRALRSISVSLVARQETKRRQAVAQFAATVAHDINNLLMVILGNAETLAERLPAGHELREEVDGIRAGSRRTAQVARRFLALVRNRPEQLRRLNLSALVYETVHSSRTAMPPSVRLTAEVPSEALSCDGSESLLASSLLNLILNGRDAITGRGRVTVQMRQVTLDGPPAGARGTFLVPGSYAEVDVVDSGCGMDDNLQEQLFQPFFTTKTGGSGTGLGLSAVLETMQGHHGAVRVRSRPGEGTTVTFWLPLVATEVEDNDGEPSLLPAGLRVLVIEDEPFVRQVLERSLVVSGARASGAESYSEACALLSDPTQFDALVVDMLMPGGSGVSIIEDLRARGVRLPVVLHSGLLTSADEARIRSLDAITLRKPCTREELVHSIIAAQRLVETSRVAASR